jgi:hypothetical protein
VEKRAGSDAIFPALRKKKALSGTYPAGKLHLTLETNPALSA